MSEYKDGRGDYYLAEGKREERQDNPYHLPWMDEPCTCPEKKTYGDHQVGCPRAMAFHKYMEAEHEVDR